ncbi:MAG TPA: prepilin-type N-terminal cleavage/methylation domain-containing protein [Candidatus Angelobacter sp.]|nr:prepilin-type N-terminal cleavage/methylation domain-containing protein [Candidatus Angelobacter sp.]
MGRQKGFSLIELLIVVAIILIIAAIAIPNLLRARIAANDAAAVSTLRTLNTSQTTYVTSYPLSGFAPDLKSLGPNGLVCGIAAPTPTSACLIDDQLGCAAVTCPKGGFNYMMTSTSATPVPDYTASASPFKTGTTGSRNFCTNMDAIIRQSPLGTAQFTAPETTANCGDVTKYSAVNN